jgi:hypothetical protein
LSQIQIKLSRDTKFRYTCMRTHHTLVFILGHVTVYPLPIRLVASRFRHVAPPDLPVASCRVQNTFTTSLYKLCHTSDSLSREEGGSLHTQENPEPNSAVIVQEESFEKGALDLRPIAFLSRNCNAAERNYSPPEREALAIVWAIKLARPYVERTKFVVRTDQQALRWLFASSHEDNSRPVRWRLCLAEYDFTVEYKTRCSS